LLCRLSFASMHPDSRSIGLGALISRIVPL
jgi:hypothetical protein